MSGPLMPKATAVWLLDNTTLTFEQIGEFCNLHPLEVQAIADGELAQGIVGMDPITTGQLLREEIKRCEADPAQRLQLLISTDQRKRTSSGARYTPIARRQDRPNAIYWLLKSYPTLTDAQIGKLVGTTKSTIDLIRTRKHWNMQNIKGESPVMLGICSQQEIDEMLARNEKKANPIIRVKTAKKKEVTIKKKVTIKKEKGRKMEVKKSTTKLVAKKATAKKPVVKKVTKPATKKTVVKKETKVAAKKPTVKKVTKPATKKTVVKKETKVTAKKPTVKKVTKPATKKTVVKKETKVAAKKPTVKKVTKPATKKPAVKK